MNPKTPINTPICNSTSYEWTTAQVKKHDNRGISYSRCQHENLLELQTRIAQLYKREACAVFPSGMNAIYMTLHTIMKEIWTRTNDSKLVLYMNELYCDTPKVIKELCQCFNWNMQSFVKDYELLELVEKYGEQIGIIFAESASNPHGMMIKPDTYAMIKKIHPNYYR